MLRRSEVGVLFMAYSLARIVHITSNVEGVPYYEGVVFAIRPSIVIFILKMVAAYLETGIIFAVVGKVLILVVVERCVRAFSN